METLTEPIAAAERPPLRDTFNGWFVTHEVAWELAMAALAVLYVALGFLVDEVDAGKRPEIEAVELVLTGLFVLEFGSRILAARSRLAYLRGHWIDIVALAPPIRIARPLRLLRLLRLVRAFAGIYRAGLHVNGLARHKGFVWLLLAWLGVMASAESLSSAGGSLVCDLERLAALYWRSELTPGEFELGKATILRSAGCLQ